MQTIIRVTAGAIAIALPCAAAVAGLARAPQQPAPGAALSIALPAGEAKDLVIRACGGCHEPTLVMFTREDEEGWAAIVNDMVARGARATEREIPVITAYLGKHFNRQSKFAPLQNIGTGAATARDEKELFAAGKEIYGTLCSVCHGADGRGRDKVAPPVVESPITLGPPSIPIRVMLHGKRGPTNVMPALGPLMTDAQIAAALTYVRREWGQTASPIDAAAVSEIRKSTTGRARPWTAEELWKGQSDKGESHE